VTPAFQAGETAFPLVVTDSDVRPPDKSIFRARHPDHSRHVGSQPQGPLGTMLLTLLGLSLRVPWGGFVCILSIDK